MERLARDEHFCILQTFVNYSRKKFYNIGPIQVSKNGKNSSTLHHQEFPTARLPTLSSQPRRPVLPPASATQRKRPCKLFLVECLKNFFFLEIKKKKKEIIKISHLPLLLLTASWAWHPIILKFWRQNRQSFDFVTSKKWWLLTTQNLVKLAR